MSHFFVMVLVPKNKDVEKSVAKLLAPYDENLEVPAYDRACYCIGSDARNAAIEAADAVETLDAIRARHREAFTADYARQAELESLSEPSDAEKAEYKTIEVRMESAWREMIASYEARQKAAFEGHPLRTAADPECDSCHGAGTYRSTSNPKSKWDWYVIGGRWNGRIRGRRVESDELERNTAVVSKLPNPLPDDRVPYALVTPDGTWHERGRMGWWGMSSDNKPLEEWTNEVGTLLAQNSTCVAVGVDCHI